MAAYERRRAAQNTVITRFRNLIRSRNVPDKVKAVEALLAQTG